MCSGVVEEFSEDVNLVVSLDNGAWFSGSVTTAGSPSIRKACVFRCTIKETINILVTCTAVFGLYINPGGASLGLPSAVLLGLAWIVTIPSWRANLN